MFNWLEYVSIFDYAADQALEVVTNHPISIGFEAPRSCDLYMLLSENEDLSFPDKIEAMTPACVGVGSVGDWKILYRGTAKSCLDWLGAKAYELRRPKHLPPEPDSDLRAQVRSIANDLSHWDHRTGEASDFTDRILDIQYTVDAQGNFLGARLLICFGGPNIWINTQTLEVEGYWGTDRFSACFDDELCLNDFCEDMYMCL